MSLDILCKLRLNCLDELLRAGLKYNNDSIAAAESRGVHFWRIL
jgi:hypothetical protein